MKATEIAKRLGIGYRTKRSNYVLRDRGIRCEGGPVEHVLAGILRLKDKPMVVHLAAYGLLKAISTGRMEVSAANCFRETYTPYQVCKLVALVAYEIPDNQGVAVVSDEWVHANRERIINRDI